MTWGMGGILPPPLFHNAEQSHHLERVRVGIILISGEGGRS